VDIGEAQYSEPLVKSFLGHICTLSTQKFSSNVIEKCLRVAEPQSKAAIIDELTSKVNLENMLRDQFGNYCVQTALDYAEPDVKAKLVENIRPLLPSLRATPHGRRIQSKIQDGDEGPSGSSSGHSTPRKTDGRPRSSHVGGVAGGFHSRNSSQHSSSNSNNFMPTNGSFGNGNFVQGAFNARGGHMGNPNQNRFNNSSFPAANGRQALQGPPSVQQTFPSQQFGRNDQQGSGSFVNQF
jgi:Pumilio-family RNA binding repeat